MSYSVPIERDSIFGDTHCGVPNPFIPHVSPYPTRFHGPVYRYGQQTDAYRPAVLEGAWPLARAGSGAARVPPTGVSTVTRVPAIDRRRPALRRAVVDRRRPEVAPPTATALGLAPQLAAGGAVKQVVGSGWAAQPSAVSSATADAPAAGAPLTWWKLGLGAALAVAAVVLIRKVGP